MVLLATSCNSSFVVVAGVLFVFNKNPFEVFIISSCGVWFILAHASAICRRVVVSFVVNEYVCVKCGWVTSCIFFEKVVLLWVKGVALNWDVEAFVGVGAVVDVDVSFMGLAIFRFFWLDIINARGMSSSASMSEDILRGM